tara:strand:- start:1300 stop:1740 length:441 start_codon:yes stop_codon:yes gene_type:complete
MTLYEEILQFDEFFTSIRRHDDFLVFDLKLPLNWEDKNILNQRGDKIQMKTGSKNENHKIISFFTPFSEEGTSLLIGEIKAIIKWNTDIEEKSNLLNMKMMELKKMFSENNVDALRKLEFNFTPNMILNEKGKEGRLVATRDIKGQ